MQLTTKDGNRTSQIVALAIVESAVFLAIFVFWISRNDAANKGSLLVMIIALISNLMGLGGGILVGGGGTHTTTAPDNAQITRTSTTSTQLQPTNETGEQP